VQANAHRDHQGDAPGLAGLPTSLSGFAPLRAGLAPGDRRQGQEGAHEAQADQACPLERPSDRRGRLQGFADGVDPQEQ
jgi:hypothetical protein